MILVLFLYRLIDRLSFLEVLYLEYLEVIYLEYLEGEASYRQMPAKMQFFKAALKEMSKSLQKCSNLFRKG
ncbi:hypothetical protein D3C74_383770 [compost metagenome]